MATFLPGRRGAGLTVLDEDVQLRQGPGTPPPSTLAAAVTLAITVAARLQAQSLAAAATVAITTGAVLTTGIRFKVGASLKVTVNAPLTTPTISGGKKSHRKVTGPTAAFAVTGFTAGIDGDMLYLHNPLSQTMTIKNENASSTAANRITTLTGADVVLRANAPSFATLMYDGGSSRWILISTN